ncbi:uncharacterized protein [Rutidosis leptorrhynchoides]|uniref:uncharacterized protein n=1 Tax=Rutidosis leptorrhynchoides TaxID=125765 RepID=UPI003A991B04
MALVRWSKACLPKECGGLGIIPLRLKNLTLLAKWSLLSPIWFDLVKLQRVDELFDIISPQSGVGRFLWFNDLGYGLDEERDLYEESQLQTLLALLGPISHNNDKGDEIQRVHSVDKVYSVAEGTRITLVANLNVEFDWVNVVWNKSIPSKITIFHWLAIQGGILVKEVLHFRHCLRDGSDDKCGWCSDIESIDHLLLHCPWSYSIWAAMFKWWNIYWVMPSPVSEFSLDCYKGLGINASKFWSLIGPATYWAIWLA